VHMTEATQENRKMGIKPKAIALSTLGMVGFFGYSFYNAMPKTPEERAKRDAEFAIRKQDEQVEKQRAEAEAELIGIVKATRREAEMAITRSARNPDSVKFGRIDVVFDPFAAACGHFNAQNGFGGMTGMTGFVYSPKTNVFSVDHGSTRERAAFRSDWSTYCGGTYPTVKAAKR
jgi:hypothetical protein